MIDNAGNKVSPKTVDVTLEITSEGKKLSKGGIYFLFDPDKTYEELYIYHYDNPKGGATVKLAE